MILHVDHINPVSKGGGNDILNLVTSCQSCNFGKSDRELSDHSTIQAQREQLELLNERREQLKLLLEWREGLESIGDEEIQAVCDSFSTETGYLINETGHPKVRRWIKKFGLADVLVATDKACSQYINLNLEHDSDEYVSAVDRAFNAIPKIASWDARGGMPANKQQIYYIRGILRNRCNYFKDWNCLRMLNDLADAGVDMDWVQEEAKQVDSWTQLIEFYACALKNAEEDNGQD